MQDKELIKDYVEFKKKATEEVSNFISENMVFAYSKEQHEKVLKELGMSDEEFQQTYVGFMGGAIRKDKINEFNEVTNRLEQSIKNKLLSSYEFAKGAFYYEMGNYEVVYSHDYEEVFGTLSVTEEEVKDDNMLNRAFIDARTKYLEDTDG